MVSNVLGTINPVSAIIQAAHKMAIPVLLDAAQAVPSMPIDVKALDVDFLAFSGHKMYGPFGIGILYGKEHLLDAMPPFMGGGDMISEVRLEGFSVNELPYKFEAGTPPISEAIGMAAAAQWLSGAAHVRDTHPDAQPIESLRSVVPHKPSARIMGNLENEHSDGIGLDTLGYYESALAQRFIAGIEAIDGVQVLGHPLSRAGIVAFTIEDIHAHDVAALLDTSHIAVRAGHHCAHPLARRFGVVSSARASFAAYTTIDDIDAAISAIKKSNAMHDSALNLYS